MAEESSDLERTRWVEAVVASKLRQLADALESAIASATRWQVVRSTCRYAPRRSRVTSCGRPMGDSHRPR